MLQTAEILPYHRKTLRRSVAVECEVLAPIFDAPAEFRATDLSEDGLWLEAMLPLEVGEQITLRFQPPRGVDPFVLTGVVRRVGIHRRAGEAGQNGMGIEFTAMTRLERALLRSLLQNTPPALPKKRAGGRRQRRPTHATEMVWIDELLTFDDLDGRPIVSDLIDVDALFDEPRASRAPVH